MEQLKGVQLDQNNKVFRPDIPLPQLTPPQMEAVPPSSKGSIACYDTQTVYEFDEEVAGWARDWKGVAARRLTADTFELYDPGRRTRGHIHKLNKIKTPNLWGVTLSYEVDDPNPFGMSPCVYHREISRIFVRTLKQKLVRKPYEVRRLESARRGVSPELTAFKECLAEIRRLEKETPYRLIRDGNDWVFQPPTIR